MTSNYVLVLSGLVLRCLVLKELVLGYHVDNQNLTTGRANHSAGSRSQTALAICSDLQVKGALHPQWDDYG